MYTFTSANVPQGVHEAKVGSTFDRQSLVAAECNAMNRS